MEFTEFYRRAKVASRGRYFTFGTEVEQHSTRTQHSAPLGPRLTWRGYVDGGTHFSDPDPEAVLQQMAEMADAADERERGAAPAQEPVEFGVGEVSL